MAIPTAMKIPPNGGRGNGILKTPAFRIMPRITFWSLQSGIATVTGFIREVGKNEGNATIGFCPIVAVGHIGHLARPKYVGKGPAVGSAVSAVPIPVALKIFAG